MTFSGQYLTFIEYKKLGGTLENENSFNLLEYECRQKINIRTQYRLKKLDKQPSEVKLCILNLIKIIEEEYKKNSQKFNGNIASESVGRWSVSYMTGSQIKEVLDIKNIEVENCISEYLNGVIVDNVNVTYLGVL